jgi:hypothetical protein
MDIVHERAAGMDISKRDAKVCLRLPRQRAGTYTSTVTTWVRPRGRSWSCGTSWNAGTSRPW